MTLWLTPAALAPAPRDSLLSDRLGHRLVRHHSYHAVARGGKLDFDNPNSSTIGSSSTSVCVRGRGERT